METAIPSHVVRAYQDRHGLLLQTLTLPSRGRLFVKLVFRIEVHAQHLSCIMGPWHDIVNVGDESRRDGEPISRRVGSNYQLRVYYIKSQFVQVMLKL